MALDGQPWGRPDREVKACSFFYQPLLQRCAPQQLGPTRQKKSPLPHWLLSKTGRPTCSCWPSSLPRRACDAWILLEVKASLWRNFQQTSILTIGGLVWERIAGFSSWRWQYICWRFLIIPYVFHHKIRHIQLKPPSLKQLWLLGWGHWSWASPPEEHDSGKGMHLSKCPWFLWISQRRPFPYFQAAVVSAIRLMSGQLPISKLAWSLDSGQIWIWGARREDERLGPISMLQVLEMQVGQSINPFRISLVGSHIILSKSASHIFILTQLT